MLAFQAKKKDKDTDKDDKKKEKENSKVPANNAQSDKDKVRFLASFEQVLDKIKTGIVTKTFRTV